jgi:two-component system chemotaxis response regulator CheY
VKDLDASPARGAYDAGWLKGLSDRLQAAGAGVRGELLPTILVADDNEDLRSMMRQFLESHGYGVLEAADGREAAEAAVRERPALVIMDLGMPHMDGLSAVREIRRHASAPETEILIVSAYDRLEFRTEAIAAGCGGFMITPVEPAALLKAVRLLLRQGDADAATL